MKMTVRERAQMFREAPLIVARGILAGRVTAPTKEYKDPISENRRRKQVEQGLCIIYGCKSKPRVKNGKVLRMCAYHAQKNNDRQSKSKQQEAK
jgi:hypothetical protein